jgi:hypothetical protein
MNKILNITNGDCAVDVLKKASVEGDFIPWRDVLHEGPVLPSLSLEELSKVRAQFIIDRGWGDPDSVNKGFSQRDRKLASCGDYKKVVMWFEHDLYDQLQILQILNWFSGNKPLHTSLSLICTDTYLGTASSESIDSLLPLEQSVTEEQMNLAARAWVAFTDCSPHKWCALLHQDTDCLPFLKDTVLRLLQEYPHIRSGLSRTALRAMKIIATGKVSQGRAFGLYQKTEEAGFLGDLQFFSLLKELASADRSLLSLSGNDEKDSSGTVIYSITPTGRKVLEGKLRFDEVSRIDRWIGGVHLTNGNLWFWDDEDRKFLRC